MTLSLKVFDSALERRYSQLHMCVSLFGAEMTEKQLLPYKYLDMYHKHVKK